MQQLGRWMSISQFSWKYHAILDFFYLNRLQCRQPESRSRSPGNNRFLFHREQPSLPFCGFSIVSKGKAADVGADPISVRPRLDYDWAGRKLTASWAPPPPPVGQVLNLFLGLPRFEAKEPCLCERRAAPASAPRDSARTTSEGFLCLSTPHSRFPPPFLPPAAPRHSRYPSYTSSSLFKS